MMWDPGIQNRRESQSKFRRKLNRVMVHRAGSVCLVAGADRFVDGESIARAVFFSGEGRRRRGA